MLEDVLEKAEQFQNFCIKKCNAHYLAAEINGKRNRFFGIPVAAITAVVATSIFGTLSQKETVVWLSIITGGLSILAAILSSLQTFLRYSEVAQEHRTAAVGFESMRRKLDLFLLKYRGSDDRQAALDRLEKLSADIDAISQNSPTLPDAVYDAVKWRPASVRHINDPDVQNP